MFQSVSSVHRTVSKTYAPVTTGIGTGVALASHCIPVTVARGTYVLIAV